MRALSIDKTTFEAKCDCHEHILRGKSLPIMFQNITLYGPRSGNERNLKLRPEGRINHKVGPTRKKGARDREG